MISAQIFYRLMVEKGNTLIDAGKFEEFYDEFEIIYQLETGKEEI